MRVRGVCDASWGAVGCRGGVVVGDGGPWGVVSVRGGLVVVILGGRGGSWEVVRCCGYSVGVASWCVCD